MVKQYEPEPLDEEISFIRCTFDDGSRSDFPLYMYDTIVGTMIDYAVNGKEIVVTTLDIAGARSVFFISKLQDLIESTPAIRKRTTDLNASLKEELPRTWREIE